jgi:hypothetical protein
LTPGVPSPSPSYKNCTTSCSRPPLLAGILSARLLPRAPSSSAFGRGSVSSSSSTRCPLSPSATVPPSRPEHRRTKGVPQPGSWAPPAGHHRQFSHPSAATNRRVVSSSSFPTHPPAETPTGAAEFRRAAPAGPPRDHIAKLEFFSRASLQLVTLIVKLFWLLLVNCAENHRKIRKM